MVMSSLCLPSLQNLRVALVMSRPPVLLRNMKIALRKFFPPTLSWWSMNGLMPSIIPSGILSISSKINTEFSHCDTLPRIQSWTLSLYISAIPLLGKWRVDMNRWTNLLDIPSLYKLSTRNLATKFLPDPVQPWKLITSAFLGSLFFTWALTALLTRESTRCWPNRFCSRLSSSAVRLGRIQAAPQHSVTWHTTLSRADHMAESIIPAPTAMPAEKGSSPDTGGGTEERKKARVRVNVTKDGSCFMLKIVCVTLS